MRQLAVAGLALTQAAPQARARCGGPNLLTAPPCCAACRLPGRLLLASVRPSCRVPCRSAPPAWPSMEASLQSQWSGVDPALLQSLRLATLVRTARVLTLLVQAGPPALAAQRGGVPGLSPRSWALLWTAASPWPDGGCSHGEYRQYHQAFRTRAPTSCCWLRIAASCCMLLGAPPADTRPREPAVARTARSGPAAAWHHKRRERRLLLVATCRRWLLSGSLRWRRSDSRTGWQPAEDHCLLVRQPPEVPPRGSCSACSYVCPSSRLQALTSAQLKRGQEHGGTMGARSLSCSNF